MGWKWWDAALGAFIAIVGAIVTWTSIYATASFGSVPNVGDEWLGIILVISGLVVIFLP